MRMLILCVWLTWQPFFIEMAGQKGKRTCRGMLHYFLYTHKTDIPSEHRGDFESAVLKRVEKWKWYEDDSITSTSYGRPSQNKRAAPTQLAGAPRYYCNSQTKQAGWKCGASLLNIWLGQGCRAARLPIGFTATFQDWWCVDSCIILWLLIDFYGWHHFQFSSHLYRFWKLTWHCVVHPWSCRESSTVLPDHVGTSCRSAATRALSETEECR